MEQGIGWPTVAMALIVFAKTDTVTFLLTVPLTGIVVLVGAFLFLRIVVIRPISMMTNTYMTECADHTAIAMMRCTPELPLK